MKTKNPPIVIRDKRLNSARQILESWREVMTEYPKRYRVDLPYWYRERTHVGFLSIAAWLRGWATLEEWGLKKGSHRKPSQGRNDLWIGRNGKPDFFIEAKHIFCDVHKGAKHCDRRLRLALDSANASACKLNCDYPSKKIAVVFASPLWKENGKLSLNEARKEWLRVCTKELDVGAVSLITTNRREASRGNDEFLVLGSALLMVVASRAKSYT